MKELMRDRVLKILVDACPHELRFTDIFERAGEKSRTIFSKTLQTLCKEGLVTKQEYTRRFVTYKLNAEAYKKKLQADKKQLSETEKKLSEKRSGMCK